MPIITELAKDENVYFNISDDEGCSEMSQILLKDLVINKNRVCIYFIGDKPKSYIDKDFMYFQDFKHLKKEMQQ